MSSVFESDSTGDSTDDEPTEETSNEQWDKEGELRSQLGDIPLGELQKLRETVGLKKYNEAMFGTSAEKVNSSKEDPEKQRKIKLDEEKKKKSEPEETSSKRRTFKPRNVVEITKRKHRDPRFDNLSGKFNEDLFQKSYSFVDELKKSELETVKRKLKKTKDKEEKTSLHKLLQRMEGQEEAKTQKMNQRETEKGMKKVQFEARRAGKKVFYMKKSEAKKKELFQKYKTLKDSGQLEKVMRKKRKHNSSKEKKKFLSGH